MKDLIKKFDIVRKRLSQFKQDKHSLTSTILNSLIRINIREHQKTLKLIITRKSTKPNFAEIMNFTKNVHIGFNAPLHMGNKSLGKKLTYIRSLKQNRAWPTMLKVFVTMDDAANTSTMMLFALIRKIFRRWYRIHWYSIWKTLIKVISTIHSSPGLKISIEKEVPSVSKIYWAIERFKGTTYIQQLECGKWKTGKVHFYVMNKNEEKREQRRMI